MNVQEEIDLQAKVKAHWQEIGQIEIHRRSLLLGQAEKLISRLFKKAQTIPAFHNELRQRIVKIAMKACERSNRRAKHLYGQ